MIRSEAPEERGGWFARNRTLIATVVGSLAILIAVAVIHPGDPVEDPSETYSSYAAHADGYAVWYELIKREGFPVARFERHLVHLDDSVATLITAKSSSGFPMRSSQGESLDETRLDAWIANGGRLVKLNQTCTPFLRRVHHCPAITRTTTTQHKGRGEIVTVGNPDIFTDAEIGKGRRAVRALEIATSGRAHGDIAFYERDHGHAVDDHWWQIAPPPVAAGIGFALLATAIWFAGIAWRFGPPLMPRPSGEDSSTAFVNAVAALLARGRAQTTTRDEMIATTLDRVEGIYGTGADPDVAALRALREPGTMHADLIHSVRLAQRVRKAHLT